jgi:hypothetical protein
MPRLVYLRNHYMLPSRMVSPFPCDSSCQSYMLLVIKIDSNIGNNVVVMNTLPLCMQSLDALLDDAMCVAYFNSFLLREWTSENLVASRHFTHHIFLPYLYLTVIDVMI